jgi:hypothetical protein
MVVQPRLEQFAGYQVNTFNPMGGVYLYHPLTEIDLSSFNNFIVGGDAYQFLNGAIDIIGHEGLLPLLKK